MGETVIDFIKFLNRNEKRGLGLVGVSPFRPPLCTGLSLPSGFSARSRCRRLPPSACSPAENVSRTHPARPLAHKPDETCLAEVLWCWRVDVRTLLCSSKTAMAHVRHEKGQSYPRPLHQLHRSLCYTHRDKHSRGNEIWFKVESFHHSVYYRVPAVLIHSLGGLRGGLGGRRGRLKYGKHGRNHPGS